LVGASVTTTPMHSSCSDTGTDAVAAKPVAVTVATAVRIVGGSAGMAHAQSRLIAAPPTVMALGRAGQVHGYAPKDAENATSDKSTLPVFCTFTAKLYVLSATSSGRKSHAAVGWHASTTQATTPGFSPGNLAVAATPCNVC
jgi:hypothetical protein